MLIAKLRNLEPTVKTEHARDTRVVRLEEEARIETPKKNKDDGNTHRRAAQTC